MKLSASIETVFAEDEYAFWLAAQAAAASSVWDGDEDNVYAELCDTRDPA